MAKSIDFKNLTRRNLADAVGKSERTIGNWLERGLPRKPNQRYDLPAVIDWILLENEIATGESGVDSEALERMRLAKAEMLELDLQTKKGELVLRSEVDADLFAMARKVRDSILGVPPRLAAELAAESSAHVVGHRLFSELTAALASLGGSSDDFDFPPPPPGWKSTYVKSIWREYFKGRVAGEDMSYLGMDDSDLDPDHIPGILNYLKENY